MASCLSCGAEQRPGARFCDSCGASTATEPSPDRRKLATLLFCDMSGSTALGERVDAESVRTLMFRYFHVMRGAIERHGGTVEKFVGDAVMAVFGVPEAHEDDALRAVRAAGEMQERMAPLNDELESRFGTRIALRIGVNTGEVVAGDSSSRETFVTGDAVNVAARLEQAAGPGEVLLGPETMRLTQHAVTADPVEPLALRGKSEPLPAFRLRAVDAAAPSRPERRLGVTLVGRDDELRILRESFEEAVATGACSLLTLVGEPGAGKSRLAAALSESLAGRANVLTGRCLAYGEGTTYWPLGEIVRSAAGVLDEDTAGEALARIAALFEGEADRTAGLRLGQAIGLAEGAAETVEIAWAVRRLIATLAGRQPLLVLIDDLQWAEPVLLDLVASLTALRNAPALVLCLARPELLERRPEWTAGVRLEPLTGVDAGRLVETILGGETDAAVRDRIVEAAGGNPLFVEELIEMLVEEGMLKRENGSWEATGELSRIAIPPTLNALLGARLDRLPSPERAALERGAVEGELFHRGGVQALGGDPTRLDRLVERELLRAAAAEFADEAAFRFRHILIRDAAYSGTAKQVRADLHERFADWLLVRAGDRLEQFEEILGYHLEQAYRFRIELGPPDEGALALAQRAAERLGASGLRALGRADFHAARVLLSRAAGLLANDHALRVELLPALSDAVAESGDFGRAFELAREAVALAEPAGDERLLMHARLRLVFLRGYTDPELGIEEIASEADRAFAAFEAAGDDQGVARVWVVRGLERFDAGRLAEAATFLERAVDHARRSGDRRTESFAAMVLLASYTWGPIPVRDVLHQLDELTKSSVGHPLVQQAACALHAVALAYAGDFEAARSLERQAITIVDELGMEVWRGAVRAVLASVEELAGDTGAQEALLRTSVEILDRAGEKRDFSQGAVALAGVLLDQGRAAESAEWLARAEEAGTGKDIPNKAGLHILRARLSARAGDIDTARPLAATATELAERTDVPGLHGDVWRGAAEVFELAGDIDAAAAALTQARAAYERKGIVVLAERVSQQLAALER